METICRPQTSISPAEPYTQNSESILAEMSPIGQDKVMQRQKSQAAKSGVQVKRQALKALNPHKLYMKPYGPPKPNGPIKP